MIFQDHCFAYLFVYDENHNMRPIKVV